MRRGDSQEGARGICLKALPSCLRGQEQPQSHTHNTNIQSGSCFWESDHPVKQRQEYLVARVGAIVVRQMAPARSAYSARKPPAHMDPLVNFFDQDEVHGKSRQDSRRDAQSQRQVERDDRHAVQDEQQNHPQRRTA
jgi:hypothetical protein